jgi:D-alanine transaminase
MHPVPPNVRTVLANINGATMPLAEAKVPALDRGFLFGDAVYEVVRVYQGKPWLMTEHWQRLAYSLEQIRIAGVDLERLQQRVLQTIKQGSFGEAIIYVQITRGAAPRAHPFPADTVPLEFFYVQEFTDPYVTLRQDGGCAITHPDLRWQRCDIKSTNLLGNVLAMQAAKEAGCVEALLVRDGGVVTEGTHTSLFGVRDGVLLVPPRGTSRLPGITWGFISGLTQRHQISTREQALTVADFARLDELFLTGTTTEVLPLIQVDDRKIAAGKPGPVTRRLQEAYREAVKEFVTQQQ